MNLFMKQKQTHRHIKQTIVSKEERGQERINQEPGISIQTTIYIYNQTDNSIGNYIQYPVKNHNGKGYLYIHITKSLCCTPETKTMLEINHCNSSILKKDIILASQN